MQAVNFRTILVRTMTENHMQPPTVFAIFRYVQFSNSGIAQASKSREIKD